MAEPEPNIGIEEPSEPEATIRAAAQQDVERFLTNVWQTIYNKGSFPALLDPNRLPRCDEFFVAELDGEIVGTVTLAGLRNERRPTVDMVYVVPSHRGDGIGSRLCEAALRRFKETGKVPVYCDVTTRKMQGVIDRLSPDVRAFLKPDFSYQRDGDEWENREG